MAAPATHQSEYYVEDIYGHKNEEGGFDLEPKDPQAEVRKAG